MSAKKVLALVDDLFFAAKIGSTAKNLGVTMDFAKSREEVLAKLELEKPGLIILDLNASAGQPIETIHALKSDPRFADIPTLGFLSHVQIDLKERALQAGCDSVLPRSAFSQNLPALLTKSAQDAGD
jgi:CheY-like chemotaxis protein